MARIGEDAEYVLIYHGPTKFKGRAEFLRIMLEDAGADYSNSAKDLYGETGSMNAFRARVGGEADVAKDCDTDKPYPLFFPPAIWHRPKDGKGEEVRINQVAACCTYLGEQLGYAPASSAERARADCIAQNASDYISEGRLSFHPVKNTASYYDQKEEADRVSLEWSKGKMACWLAYFEKVLRSQHGDAAADKPVAGGPGVTYADFCLFHVLDATISQFNNEKYEFAWDKLEGIPLLKAFHQKFAARPRLVEYRASDRCVPFDNNSMM